MEPMGRSIWQTARAGGSTKIVRFLAILIAVVVLSIVLAPESRVPSAAMSTTTGSVK